MKSFSVKSYYRLKYNNLLVENENTSCWAGINNSSYIRIPDTLKEVQAIRDSPEKGINPFKSNFIKPYLYIAEYEDDVTKDYIKLLLGLINDITYCKIVSNKEKGKLIKFKFLKTYDQNLILLNFIRNLWYQPIQGYTKRFFDELKENKNNLTDPLERLTHANKEACEMLVASGNLRMSPGHSNIHAKDLKIKNTSELLKYEEYSTAQFLTT